MPDKREDDVGRLTLQGASYTAAQWFALVQGA